MTDGYDPETFDWGDDTPGINLADLGDDIVEQAVNAALNVQEEKYGWRYLKKSELKESGGRLLKVKHFMPVEHRSWFEEHWPGYTFVWDTAVEHHDHPVAHLVRELNEIEMYEDVVRSGEQVIDLFGNGGRQSKYKRNCINLYTLATARDYIRHQNVGARDFVYDIEKLCDRSHVFGKIDRVMCTDALYYLTLNDIGRIVNTSQKRKLTALVFRHKETFGTLNRGEQEYRVSQAGTVTQVNCLTGESYSHPSLEALFHQFSAKTPSGGVTWTIRSGGGDGFIIDFVGCPNAVCGEYTRLKFLSPETWHQYTFSNLTVRKFLRWTWITASTKSGDIIVEDTDLFSKLRRYVAGKQRTPRLKAELMQHARRLCNKEDIISIHGGGASDVPPASMSDYVELAFYVDVRHELDAAVSFHKGNIVMTTALNKYYESGTLPRDFSAITGNAVISARIFSDAAIKVINHVRDDVDRANAPDWRLTEDELREFAFDNPLVAPGVPPGHW